MGFPDGDLRTNLYYFVARSVAEFRVRQISMRLETLPCSLTGGVLGFKIIQRWVTVKDGRIEIPNDQREKIVAELESPGENINRVGG
jgi:hypothetical protein